MTDSSLHHMTNGVTVTNATAILADQLWGNATVRIDNGVISLVEQAGLNSTTDQENVIDARGGFVMPGVIDLHNDNLEHEINPRAKANLPIHFALGNMERRLAASGVTTEFHSMSFQNQEKKGRSILGAAEKAAFVQKFEDDPMHGVRHHIQHRLDVRTEDSVEMALPTLLNAKFPFASLNDHTPGQGQYRDVERLIRMAHEQAESRNGQKTDPEWYRERMLKAMQDTETVPRFYQKVGELMATSELKLATHDDDTVEKVEEQLSLGASIAEFPVTFEAAEFARQHGLDIIVGAPNIVRGGSQSGNLNAKELIERDLADIIVADYHSASLLPAAWTLANDGLLDLPAAVRMLTLNPARALNMHDRGSIEVGMLGDLCIVHTDDAGWPRCETTIVGGMVAFHYLANPGSRSTMSTVARNVSESAGVL